MSDLQILGKFAEVAVLIGLDVAAWIFWHVYIPLWWIPVVILLGTEKRNNEWPTEVA